MRKGFSIIELLVVIAIIGVLSTLAMVAVQSARNSARIGKAKHDVDVIVTAIKQLENDSGQWPGHQDPDDLAAPTNELWDLNAPEAGITATDGNFVSWRGPYMSQLRPDPWGNEYFFDSDYQINGDDHVVVGSFGPNGVGQNLFDSDDIVKVLR